MLDNFGMGEFLTLALFALLFFGPQRLPQMGAQLGRWLSKLTSYSKAFMTQWSEEAAAVQGAVQDVMSIRDEIRAAQAEIAQTLSEAQQDINDTIAVAKNTVREATPTAKGFVEASGVPALANAEEANRFQRSRSASSSGDDGQAVSKTQKIVDSLLAKQGRAPAADAAGLEADAEAADSPPAQEPESPSAEVDAEAEPLDEQDAAYQRNKALIQELMGDKTETPTTSTDDPQPAAAAEEAEQPVAAPSNLVLSGTVVDGEQVGEESKRKREATESAFDKTQRVLNRLMGIPDPEPEPEPEPVSEPEAAPEPSILPETLVQESVPPAQAPAQTPDDAGGGSPADVSSLEQEPVVDVAARPASAAQQVRSSGNGVSMGEFTKLSIEVTLLKRELDVLRDELQTLRAAKAGQEGASASALPVEEAA